MERYPTLPEITEAVKRENKRLQISHTSPDLGSRALIKQAKTLYWNPSEVNVSIRPGRFYHPEEDKQVKSLSKLVDIYFQSVGMNSVLLLNVPPDTRGRIHEVDAARLKQFGAYITELFKNQLLNDATGEWKARSGASKEYMVQNNKTINTLMLQEDISKGQRVESFTVEGLFNETWSTLAEGTTIGYKRLLRFADSRPSKLRITIHGTRDVAHILKVGAYHAPALPKQATH